jgi:hypothetical protein
MWQFQPRPCTFAALAIAPLPAKTFSPYLIGILVSVHLPACITEGKSMFKANRSCAAARVRPIRYSHVWPADQLPLPG